MTERRLMINADDFGWTDGHNLAIERAHRQGVLNRASLLANGEAFSQAVAISQQLPGLGVGVHLALNEGRPLLPSKHLPNLTRPDGCFHDDLKSLIRLYAQQRLLTHEVLPEWRAQIERVVNAGISITHLDSHKHVHLFPPLLQAAVTLAVEYRIPYVRLPLESLNRDTLWRGPAWLVLWSLCLPGRRYLRTAGLHFADHFVGFSASGAMTPTRLAHAIAAAPQGTTEIMVHPAIVTPAVTILRQKFRWATHYQFEEELQALCAPGLALPGQSQPIASAPA